MPQIELTVNDYIYLLVTPEQIVMWLSEPDESVMLTVEDAKGFITKLEEAIHFADSESLVED